MNGQKKIYFVDSKYELLALMRYDIKKLKDYCDDMLATANNPEDIENIYAFVVWIKEKFLKRIDKKLSVWLSWKKEEENRKNREKW